MDTPRDKFKRVEGAMPHLAQMVGGLLPEGIGLALLCFTLNGRDDLHAPGSNLTFVSTANPSDLAKLLREAADNLDAGALMPPGSSLERH